MKTKKYKNLTKEQVELMQWYDQFKEDHGLNDDNIAEMFGYTDGNCFRNSTRKLKVIAGIKSISEL